jgi:hypothetical protein
MSQNYFFVRNFSAATTFLGAPAESIKDEDIYKQVAI